LAIYYFNIKSFGRSAGGRATSAAAYRAGERIRDERTGQVFDHSHRTDVMHKAIVLPVRYAAADLNWALDRSALWNAAELVESRINAKVAREYLVALPHELEHGQRLNLVQGFAQDLADRHGFAVDFAIHAPRLNNDPRNFHAHLLTTTREVLPTGLGAKTNLDIGSAQREARGLGSALKELYAVRERWADFTNRALRDANIQAQVDHRSLKAQGIDREPLPRIPIGAWHTEQHGRRSDIADRIRAAYRERIQARLQRAIARASSPESEGKLDDVRRLARQSWLQIRDSLHPKVTSATVDSARTQGRDSQKDHDFGSKPRDDDLAL
jgi:ATP-dependent exoDNAse (exonuclease V) alpha subunit